MLLAPLLACLTSVPLTEQDAQRTYVVAATEVQVRLPLPGARVDEQRTELLKKSSGEHMLLAGWLGATDDVRVTIMGGPAPSMDGDVVRKGVLGDRLLGMGVSTVAGYASAQTIRTLNPPYREFDRHAFLLGANTVVHVQVIALEQGDPEKFGDASFEKILSGARFAVVRRTAWDDLPARYLELSNAAAKEVDGVKWLRERAGAPGAGWIEKLVALEHAHAARSKDEFLVEWGADVRGQLLSIPERTREQTACLMVAEDGLGLALLRAGETAAAEEHLVTAYTLAEPFGARAKAGVLTSLAFAAASKKEVDGAVALLTQAEKEDPANRYRLQQEPLLDPVRKDPRVDALLKIVLKAPVNRSLGGH